MVHSPEKIVEILHSIAKLNLVGKAEGKEDNRELFVFFKDGDYSRCDSGYPGDSITSFVRNSFTRQLLELIEDYLKQDATDP